VKGSVLRVFLLVEALSFTCAALVHFGVLARGDEHQAAGTAESAIAAVLWIGLGVCLAWPARGRAAALVAQAFALLGTLVGVGTIAAGIGPRTVPDLAYHAAILVVLAWGLVVAARAPGFRTEGSA
jgi:hypothetical protein